MSNYKVWFETAIDHFDKAKKSYKNNDYCDAYEKAIYCGEVLLKSILVKNGKFSNQRDRTHDIKQLLDRIEEEGCLPSDLIEKAKEFVNEYNKDSFNYINLTSIEGDHVDGFSRQIPNLRYPVGDATPSQMVVDADAKRKINQVEELLNLLEPIINDVVED